METKTRAFSLLEALLALGLFSLLMTLTLSFIAPMIRASQRGSDLSDLRGEAAMTLESICQDIEQSAAPGIVVTSNVIPQVPVTLSVQQVLALSSTGTTLWSPQVHIYSWDNSRRQIRLLKCPPTPSGVATSVTQNRPCRWAPADLILLVSTNAQSTFLSGDVADFNIVGPSAHGLSGAIHIKIKLQRRTGDFVQTFSLEQAAMPAVRNTH